MHLIGTLIARLRSDDSGFAMATVVMGIAVATILAVAAVAATNSDIQLTGRSIDEKRAYEAAQVPRAAGCKPGGLVAAPSSS